MLHSLGKRLEQFRISVDVQCSRLLRKLVEVLKAAG